MLFVSFSSSGFLAFCTQFFWEEFKEGAFFNSQTFTNSCWIIKIVSFHSFPTLLLLFCFCVFFPLFYFVFPKERIQLFCQHPCRLTSREMAMQCHSLRERIQMTTKILMKVMSLPDNVCSICKDTMGIFNILHY